MKVDYLILITSKRLTYLITLFFLMSFQNLKGQYVDIPDANFINWLTSSNVSNCLNAQNQLDTTCAGVLNETTIICSQSHIVNLDGVQYFKRLRYLDCSINQLDSLPRLSDSLNYLDCSSNSISKLTSFPKKLESLNCGVNQLHTLPQLPEGLITLLCVANQLDSLPPLPLTLDTINCTNNLITSLPPLPNSLHGLDCEQNLLATIPFGNALKNINCNFNVITRLPVFDSLQFLTCAYNRLLKLPNLPNSLTTLECSYNNIDSITYLPNKMKIMGCSFNKIISLGIRLPDSLQNLSCNNNLLNNLPPLPKGLTYLDCENNLLGSLPELPDSMNELGCGNNPNLICLPKINRLNYLLFDSTSVKCIPNYGYVTSSIPALNTLPLCSVSNPNGCLTYNAIPKITEVDFSVYPNPGNHEVIISLSDPSGEYTLQVIDVTGRVVLGERPFKPGFELFLDQLQSGLYFVILKDDLGRIGERKLIKE